MARNRTLTELVGALVTPDVKEKIHQAAQAAGLSDAEWLRRAIDAKLNDNGSES